MKYLKRFEIFEFKYDTDDYVFLGNNIGKIIFTDKFDFSQTYLIRFSKYASSWFNQDQLIRLATKEEIEEYKINDTSINYNL